MNIKRAFLAAAAVLMVPGYAMAQTADFDTQVMTTNDADVTVHAALVCNTGTPLSQEDDISPGAGNGVDFVVQDLVVDGNLLCTVTFTDIPAGYTATAISTNGTDDTTVPECTWDDTELDYPAGEVSNTCYLTLAPQQFDYTMYKVWEGNEEAQISEAFQMNYTCYNVSTNTGTYFSNYGGNWWGTGDTSYTVSNFYANPNGTSYCTAYENNVDSAVDNDGGCEAPVNFDVDTATGSCTVTNTVFFEGIPTLSQYGLAILAVLMLGVGFVGFRRFV